MRNAAMVQVNCEGCKASFSARVADRKRGWGRFCSKSCKAVKQEKRTGQFSHYLQGKRSPEGSNRWTDDDGNGKARRWQPGGRSVVSTIDRHTGDVSNEHFDRHGFSVGIEMTFGEDDF